MELMTSDRELGASRELMTSDRKLKACTNMGAVPQGAPPPKKTPFKPTGPHPRFFDEQLGSGVQAIDDVRGSGD